MAQPIPNVWPKLKSYDHLRRGATPIPSADNFAGDSKKKKDLNFMGKKYKYKGTDIVKNNGVSIWKVISNRYNKTLDRLVE